jgi:hypothetical protein
MKLGLRDGRAASNAILTARVVHRAERRDISLRSKHALISRRKGWSACLKGSITVNWTVIIPVSVKQSVMKHLGRDPGKPQEARCTPHGMAMIREMQVRCPFVSFYQDSIRR